MIKKFLHSGDLENIKDNYDYKHTIKKLENDKDAYIVGVDIASPDDSDKSVVMWSLELEDGQLFVKGSRIICEYGECGTYRGWSGGCPVCHDPCY